MSAPLKVLHLTTSHPPRDARIYWKEAASLAAAGYDVVLAAPGSEANDEDGGAEGVRTHYLHRPSGRLRRIAGAPFRALKAVSEIDPDVIHFHDPELLVVGWILAKRGKQVVYDVHEDYGTQFRHKPYLHPRVRPIAGWALDRLEKRLSRSYNAIVAATEPIASRFDNHLNTRVVRNYPIADEFPRPSEGQLRDRSCIYVGTVTAERGVVELLHAAEILGTKHGITTVIAGPIHPVGFDATLRSMPGWQYVTHHSWLDRSEVQDQLVQAGVGIVTLLPSPSYEEALPVKLFEYLAAGLPIVASNFPLWEELVGEAGIVVDPTDAAAIASAVAKILDSSELARSMSNAGRDSFDAGLSWEGEAADLLAVYEKLA